MSTYPADIPLSFAHLGALDLAPPALIEILGAAGFASTSLRIQPAAPGGIAYPLATDAERAETRRRMAATGVEILYVELALLRRDKPVRDMLPMLETGAALGARRVLAVGDDTDFSAVAERLAELCALAKPFNLAIDLEFMPFKPVTSLDDAVRVLQMAGHPANGCILLDALHFYRSNSSHAQLRALDPKLIGTFQICDAPAVAPTTVEGLTFEARQRRLLPGHGGLDLRALMTAMPAGLEVGVEVPLALDFPALSAVQRAQLSIKETRTFLAGAVVRPPADRAGR